MSQGAPSTIRSIKTRAIRVPDPPDNRCQGAPSTIRCIMTQPSASPLGYRPRVREHPAPSGALRLVLRLRQLRPDESQGAPSTTRCIMTPTRGPPRPRRRSQGAPSTTRCIKTLCARCWGGCASSVREHPAPSGALRRQIWSRVGVPVQSQGAPSTIRCIKTVCSSLQIGHPARPVREHPAPSGALRREHALRGPLPEDLVREHPAPPGALRRGHVPVQDNVARPELGDTQHHQVRSIPCSRRPGCGPQSKCQRVEAGRRCGGASRGRAVSTHPVPFCCEVRTQGTRNRQRRSHTRAGSSRCVRCCVA